MAVTGVLEDLVRAVVNAVDVGGVTLSATTVLPAREGFAVNRPGPCPLIPLELVGGSRGHIAVRKVVEAHLEWLCQAPYIGVWVDRERGVLVLDQVDVVSTLSEALSLGARRRQRFVHDLAAGADLAVPPASDTLPRPSGPVQ